MKTLLIISAILLALTSCNKHLPVPCPNPYPDEVYFPDSDPTPDPDPAPDDPDDPDDPGYDDPSPCRTVNHMVHH
ncbi:MAG TPA: hypothetical protein VGM89_16865 [Puia sp.]